MLVTRDRGLRFMLPSITSLLATGLIVSVVLVLLALGSSATLENALFDPNASPTERVQSSEYWSKKGAVAVPRLTAALTHRDAKVRGHAAFALARIGPDASSALPALLRLFDDRDAEVRSYAVHAAHRVSHDRHALVATTLELMTDQKAMVRQTAVAELADFRSEVLPQAIELLDHDAAEIRVSAVELLKEYGPFIPSIRAALFRHAADPDESVRRRCYEVLGQARLLSPQLIVRGIASGDKRIVDVCLRHPWRPNPIFDERSARLLLAKLNDPDCERINRLRIVRCLGAIRRTTPEVISRLCELTAGESSHLQQAAIFSLQQLPVAWDQLNLNWNELTRSNSPQLSAAVGSLIRRKASIAIRAEFAQTATQRLQTATEAMVRRTSIAFLSGLKSVEDFNDELLAKSLQDTDAWVRWWTMTSIGDFDRLSQRAQTALLKRLTNPRETCENLKACMFSIRRLKLRSHMVVQGLIEALPEFQSRDDHLYAQAVEYLVTVAPEAKAVQKAVGESLSSENGEIIRAAALRSLGDVALPLLAKLDAIESALRSRSAAVRLSACVGLGQLGDDGRELVPDVTLLLRDGEFCVRWAAARCLRKLGSSAKFAIPELQSAAESRENLVFPMEWHRESFGGKSRLSQQTISKQALPIVEQIAMQSLFRRRMLSLQQEMQLAVHAVSSHDSINRNRSGRRGRGRFVQYGRPSEIGTAAAE